MKKPEGLPAKTSRDHDYLVSHGWRFIGVRPAKYGPHYYWDFYIAEHDTYSGQYIQGDAVSRQKGRDAAARTIRGSKPKHEQTPKK